MIFAIKPFEIHDGDGIRTTVFFKGCPLRCKWCHNPESFMMIPQLSFDKNKCINCGACSRVCNCHKIVDSMHYYDKTSCEVCGKCVDACSKNALKIYGADMSVDEIVKAVEKDELFIKECGGGVTLSGGEPLMQPELCYRLLKALKDKGYNTAVDTSCYAAESDIKKIMPYVDEFLIDIKAINPNTHKNCTGVDNRIILKNIKMIDDAGKHIEIRYPFIPGMNDGEAESIGEFVRNLNNVEKMKVLPYHNYAENKYKCLNIPYPAKDIVPPDNKQLEEVNSLLSGMGIKIYKD